MLRINDVKPVVLVQEDNARLRHVTDQLKVTGDSYAVAGVSPPQIGRR